MDGGPCDGAGIIKWQSDKMTHYWKKQVWEVGGGEGRKQPTERRHKYISVEAQ